MNRSMVLVLLLLALAFAGCTGDDAGADGNPGMDVASTEDEGLSIPAPVWEVGHAWVWKDNQGWEGTFVVSEVDGTEYRVDTTSDFGAFEAAVWGSPIIGNIRASDLAMTTPQGETAVWFDFPLEVGKQWSTDWYGTTYTSSVVEVTDNGRATLHTLRDDGSLHLVYHYDERDAWYDDFTFMEEDGSEGYFMDVTRLQTFTGEVVRAEVTEHYADEGEGPHEGISGFDFSGANDDSEVYAMLFLDCEQGAASLAVGNGQSGMGDTAAVCPDGSFHAYGPVDGDPKGDNWGIFVEIASPDAQWGAWVWLAEYERFAVP